MSNPNSFNNLDNKGLPQTNNQDLNSPTNQPLTPAVTQMPPESESAMFSSANEPVSAQANPVPSTQTQPPQGQIPTSPPPAFSPQTNSVNEFIVPSSVTSSDKKISRFGLFVVIGIVAIILIYAAVAYIYLQNKKTDEQQTPAAETDTTQESPTDTTSGNNPQNQTNFSKDYVKIVNGNVVYEDPENGARVIIDKELFSSTGITGFSRVSVSPDSSLLCFESWPPAPEPALFISNTDGSNVVEVSPNRKNCIFTTDSKRVLYESVPADNADIFIYDITQKGETNITEDLEGEAANNTYSLVGLSQDGTKAICAFESLIETDVAGQCEIDLNTLELVIN